MLKQFPSLKWILLGIGVAIGAWILYDVLTVTDQERIEAFTESLQGEFTPDKARAGYAWINPERLPVTVEAVGTSRTYRTTDEFRQEASRGVSRFYGDNFRLLKNTVEVEGERARAEIRLLGDRGAGNLSLDFEKKGEDWLIHRVVVTR